MKVWVIAIAVMKTKRIGVGRFMTKDKDSVKIATRLM